MAKSYNTSVLTNLKLQRSLKNKQFIGSEPKNASEMALYLNKLLNSDLIPEPLFIFNKKIKTSYFVEQIVSSFSDFKTTLFYDIVKREFCEQKNNLETRITIEDFFSTRFLISNIEQIKKNAFPLL